MVCILLQKLCWKAEYLNQTQPWAVIQANLLWWGCCHEHLLCSGYFLPSSMALCPRDPLVLTSDQKVLFQSNPSNSTPCCVCAMWLLWLPPCFKALWQQREWCGLADVWLLLARVGAAFVPDVSAELASPLPSALESTHLKSSSWSYFFPDQVPKGSRQWLRPRNLDVQQFWFHCFEKLSNLRSFLNQSSAALWSYQGWRWVFSAKVSLNIKLQASSAPVGLTLPSVHFFSQQKVVLPFFLIAVWISVWNLRWWACY